MQRRKFIAGMGSLAAAGAATIGTGAFTSVEADRTVDVEVVGDASAYLAITADDTPNGDHYVNESNDSVEIDLDGTDNSNGGDAFGAGLNDEANVKVANLLQITNQGTQKVNVGAAESPLVSAGPLRDGDGNNVGSVFIEELQDTNGDGTVDQAGGGFSVPDDAVPLGVGNMVDKIGLRIPDTSVLESSENLTITFAAFTDSAWNSEFGSSPPSFS